MVVSWFSEVSADCHTGMVPMSQTRGIMLAYANRQGFWFTCTYLPFVGRPIRRVSGYFMGRNMPERSWASYWISTNNDKAVRVQSAMFYQILKTLPPDSLLTWYNHSDSTLASVKAKLYFLPRLCFQRPIMIPKFLPTPLQQSLKATPWCNLHDVCMQLTMRWIRPTVFATLAATVFDSFELWQVYCRRYESCAVLRQPPSCSSRGWWVTRCLYVTQQVQHTCVQTVNILSGPGRSWILIQMDPSHVTTTYQELIYIMSRYAVLLTCYKFVIKIHAGGTVVPCAIEFETAIYLF